jgi:hypothetical protein
MAAACLAIVIHHREEPMARDYCFSSKALARHPGRSALSARRKTRASPDVDWC